MKKTILVLLIILLILVAGALLGMRYLTADVVTEQDIELTIADGSSTSLIGTQLANSGLVRNTRGFSLFSKFYEVDNQFKAGTYAFPAGKWSLAAICDMLVEGGYSSSDEVRVTIREGLTVRETIDVLVEAGLGSVDAYYAYIQNADFSDYGFIPEAADVIEPANRLEGFLFPDTYMIAEDATEQEIIDMLLNQFVKVWTENDFDAAIADSGYTLYQVVTMASLVEKEAQVAEDRPLIAGVFYKRLAINMNLESCATVQFILGEPKYPLLYEDLEVENPYNTYKNPGLPPGPIAAPGLASLEAAVHPTESDYLYFRARTDGSHRFSTTLEEHEAPHDDDLLPD